MCMYTEMRVSCRCSHHPILGPWRYSPDALDKEGSHCFQVPALHLLKHCSHAQAHGDPQRDGSCVATVFTVVFFQSFLGRSTPKKKKRWMCHFPFLLQPVSRNLVWNRQSHPTIEAVLSVQLFVWAWGTIIGYPETHLNPLESDDVPL